MFVQGGMDSSGGAQGVNRTRSEIRWDRQEEQMTRAEPDIPRWAERGDRNTPRELSGPESLMSSVP